MLRSPDRPQREIRGTNRDGRDGTGAIDEGVDFALAFGIDFGTAAVEFVDGAVVGAFKSCYLAVHAGEHCGSRALAEEGGGEVAGGGFREEGAIELSLDTLEAEGKL